MKKKILGLLVVGALVVSTLTGCNTEAERVSYNLSQEADNFNADRYIYKVPEIMISGDDEERKEWFAPEDVLDMKQLIMNRGRIPISATMVRRMMVEDNRREWMRWVNPRLHKMYDEIRKEFMTVPFYQIKGGEV